MLLLHTEDEARPDTVSEAPAWSNAHTRSHTLSKQSQARKGGQHRYTAGARKERAEAR